MFKDKTARENIERLHSQVSDRFNYQYDRMERLDEKLNLILDHLKLKYAPETEKKEPAKLVEKQVPLYGSLSIIGNWDKALSNSEIQNLYSTENKPKRKYTKRKK